MQFPPILIVDQEEAVRESLLLLLTEEGFCCFSASNEAEALAVLREEPIELITIDSQLLGSSKLLQTITEKYPDITIIIMSSYAEIDVTQKALISGAHDFIVKPIDFEELLAKFNAHLPCNDH